MGDMGQIREPARGLTFEDVWAMFQETDRKMRETDRKIQEMTARTDKQIGELGNRFGELAEHLVRPNVLEKFRTLGYTFSRAGSDVEFFDRAGKALTEADIWLENGEFVMVVEIKSRLRRRDVEEHVRRMGILRTYLDERNDRRKLLGAVAAVVVTGDMREYVPEKGFYLIEPSGDTVRITAPENFTPKVW
ncbi:MAG: hypothetical protein LBK64_04100 [Spirochaetaceae bacterium]|jgi:hypothetical protein|nr:hypothetical protein [Spirochaetaceae bacterium]